MGMRAQAFMMTIVGFAISVSLISGNMLAGSRRQRSEESSDAPESPSRAFGQWIIARRDRAIAIVTRLKA